MVANSGGEPDALASVVLALTQHRVHSTLVLQAPAK